MVLHFFLFFEWVKGTQERKTDCEIRSSAFNQQLLLFWSSPSAKIRVQCSPIKKKQKNNGCYIEATVCMRVSNILKLCINLCNYPQYETLSFWFGGKAQNPNYANSKTTDNILSLCGEHL